MTVHPALPPVLLTILTLSIAGITVAAWSRWRSSGAGRKSMWRLAGLTTAALLLVVAAVRPVLGDSARTLPAGAGDGEPNVFLVVDRSPATDMAAVRDDVAAVIDRHPGARIAVIGFASSPTLEWPLSQDVWSLQPTLDALRPYAATPETRDRASPAAASNLLRYQLISARQQFPRADNLVYYFGDGVSGRDSPPRDFLLADDTVDGGAVFGVGATRDEPALRAVADQLGVAYVADGAIGAEPEARADAPPPTASARATETYWIAALLAAVLILVEAFFVLRDIRRTRPAPMREPT